MKANKEKIGVMLVDDHAIFRMGLASLLGTVDEIEVVGDAGDGKAAIAKALELRPDVILMDMLMPNGLDGSETTRLLLEEWPEAKVVILTTYETADGIAHAKAATAYPVTLAINPMSDSEEDDIVSVKLLYRNDYLNPNQLSQVENVMSVSMTKGEFVEGQGQLWTGTIPASDIPAAGMLLRWAAQVTDASGNIWRTPSFRNPTPSPTRRRKSATAPITTRAFRWRRVRSPLSRRSSRSRRSKAARSSAT